MIFKNTYLSIFLGVLFLLTYGCVNGQETRIRTGAERMDAYLALLSNKNVGIVANHTSVVHKMHLVDTLIKRNISISRIFSPEHGFRGETGAGMSVESGTDALTGIKIVSLYGEKKKPDSDDLKGIDIMVYDIQDVGVRFYTYISTLHYIMEACAENAIPLILLDRPNPNGHYIDGPVLEPEFRSFVGMHAIPVVYGMTAGEFALMINGEGWLAGGYVCDLKVISCQDYTHQSRYALPVNPSPNLISMEAVYLYPSLCFFEGTKMNVGRGTDFPFRVYGHPDYPDQAFSYIPDSNTGNKNPLHKGQKCYGVDLTKLSADSLFSLQRINLGWILEAYQKMGASRDFFNTYFNTLAGNSRFMDQIKEGFTEEEIRGSWEADLIHFKQVRAKYLLYE